MRVVTCGDGSRAQCYSRTILWLVPITGERRSISSSIYLAGWIKGKWLFLCLSTKVWPDHWVKIEMFKEQTILGMTRDILAFLASCRVPMFLFPWPFPWSRQPEAKWVTKSAAEPLILPPSPLWRHWAYREPRTIPFSAQMASPASLLFPMWCDIGPRFWS